MILHAKIYFPEEITTILCPYTLNSFAEQFNGLKVDDCGITPMEKFSGTTTDITLKNHHTWSCTVHVLDENFQGNIYELTNW